MKKSVFLRKSTYKIAGFAYKVMNGKELRKSSHACYYSRIQFQAENFLGEAMRFLLTIWILIVTSWGCTDKPQNTKITGEAYLTNLSGGAERQAGVLVYLLKGNPLSGLDSLVTVVQKKGGEIDRRAYRIGISARDSMETAGDNMVEESRKRFAGHMSFKEWMAHREKIKNTANELAKSIEKKAYMEALEQKKL